MAGLPSTADILGDCRHFRDGPKPVVSNRSKQRRVDCSIGRLGALKDLVNETTRQQHTSVRDGSLPLAGSAGARQIARKRHQHNSASCGAVFICIPVVTLSVPRPRLDLSIKNLGIGRAFDLEDAKSPRSARESA